MMHARGTKVVRHGGHRLRGTLIAAGLASILLLRGDAVCTTQQVATEDGRDRTAKASAIYGDHQAKVENYWKRTPKNMLVIGALKSVIVADKEGAGVSIVGLPFADKITPELGINAWETEEMAHQISGTSQYVYHDSSPDPHSPFVWIPVMGAVGVTRAGAEMTENPSERSLTLDVVATIMHLIEFKNYRLPGLGLVVAKLHNQGSNDGAGHVDSGAALALLAGSSNIATAHCEASSAYARNVDGDLVLFTPADKKFVKWDKEATAGMAGRGPAVITVAGLAGMTMRANGEALGIGSAETFYMVETIGLCVGPNVNTDVPRITRTDWKGAGRYELVVPLGLKQKLLVDAAVNKELAAVRNWAEVIAQTDANFYTASETIAAGMPQKLKEAAKNVSQKLTAFKGAFPQD